MNYPQWHMTFCDASNKLMEAIKAMQDAAAADDNNPAFMKLAERMDDIHRDCFKQWKVNYDRCNEKGGK